MRVVIDTNVLVSGLLWRGPPHALLEHARNGLVSVVTSPALLTELDEVLGRAKFEVVLARIETSRERVLAELRQLAEVLEPPALAKPVCRDPDDDVVLALALAARADVIVSGDADLLALQAFEGIPILDPVQAFQQLLASERRPP